MSIFWIPKDDTGRGYNLFADLGHPPPPVSSITDYGIIVTQAYDGDEATDGIPITDFTLSGISGSVDSDADAAIFIDCAACSDWTWSSVDVTGADNDCTGEPSGITC